MRTFFRQDSRNAIGSFPYPGADPIKGMKWKTSGGNDKFLGKTYVARQRKRAGDEVLERTS